MADSGSSVVVVEGSVVDVVDVVDVAVVGAVEGEEGGDVDASATVDAVVPVVSSSAGLQPSATDTVTSNAASPRAAPVHLAVAVPPIDRQPSGGPGPCLRAVPGRDG